MVTMKTILCKAVVLINGQMGINIKVNFKMVRLRVRGISHMEMEIFTVVIFQTIYQME